MEAFSGGGNNPNDSSNQEPQNDSSLDRTTFLLARLQELKAWQRDQELRLLREQEEQMDQLACLPMNQVGMYPTNLIEGNSPRMRGIEHSNGNENFAWTEIKNRKG